MWHNQEKSDLIRLIEEEVLREIPITSTNNNHEYTGNLLEICRDWEQIANSLNRTVIECKKQWRLLLRQFLFATNRIYNIDDDVFGGDDNVAENRYPALFPVSWRFVEQMMFLVPYAGKYERRYRPDEETLNIDDSADLETGEQQPTENNANTDQNQDIFEYKFGTVNPQHLKEYVKQKLRTRAVQLKASELQYNLKQLCNSQPYLNKFTYMIQLNLEGWRHNDKIKFIHWYNKQLNRIITRQQQQFLQRQQRIQDRQRQQGMHVPNQRLQQRFEDWQRQRQQHERQEGEQLIFNFQQRQQQQQQLRQQYEEEEDEVSN